MSGLEVPGFIIGLNGLAVVFDTTSLIWKTVSSARNYGEDVAKSMNKLEMEYFRFQTWWTALENLAGGPKKASAPTLTPAPPIPSAISPLLVHLQSQVQSPITTAASSVLGLLEDVQNLLQKNGVLDIAQQVHVQYHSTLPNENTSLTLTSDVDRLRSFHKALAKGLLKRTAWFERLKYDATPWKESDKTHMKEILDSFKYWNESLYAILPHNIRDSVLEQGITGYILDDIDDAEAEAVSKAGIGTNARNRVLIDSAELLVLRQKSKRNQITGSFDVAKEIAEMSRPANLFEDLPRVYGSERPFSMVGYTSKDSSKRFAMTAPREERLIKITSASESKVLLEWYPYPPPQAGLSTWNIAQERIARLSYLLEAQKKPSTLHTLDALGFVDNPSAESFGLVYSLPTWSSARLEPITLYHILSKEIPKSAAGHTPTPIPSLPNLEQRYELAAILASTLYTFMLARWHHKRFHSSSVLFLFPSSASPLTAMPDLSKPYVGGFVVSRPDAPTEISLPGVPAKNAGLYLHPDLRVQPPNKPPKYRSVFDIYSFGLLLAEIGFWNTIPVIVLGKQKNKDPSATALRSLVLEKCKVDLGCWMGQRYRDVVLRCLNAERLDEGGVGEELNDFYWHVVLELIKCVPGG